MACGLARPILWLDRVIKETNETLLTPGGQRAYALYCSRGMYPFSCCQLYMDRAHFKRTGLANHSV
jgi:hypothetical protein